MEKITGTIEEIIYYNDDNGYTVGLLETKDDFVTFTGVFSHPTQGETMTLTGKWTHHKRYGKQFQAEHFDVILPNTLEGIVKYLSSGLIKGVGESTAHRLVESFGENTLEIMQYEPNRLLEVEGIGPKKAAMILESYQDQIEMKEVMLTLQKFGISPAYSIKIYKTYGIESVEIVKDNPYRLAEDIHGIGFKLADRVAQSLGTDLESEYRIEAGIRFVLMEAAGEGHTYLTKEVLKNHAENVLQVRLDYVDAVIANMAFRGQLFVEEINGEACIYYTPYYYAETGIANKLAKLMMEFEQGAMHDVEHLFCEMESLTDTTLTDKQRESVLQGIKYGVSVITGGPGTGKTTVINTVIKMFECLGKETLLCAPTGRAAKRITETSNKEAKTIHRLLEYTYNDDSRILLFNKNEESPIETDVVIVDEVSMVDVILMNALLKAIKPGTRLILVGDVDQLPSVGAGNVLKDIIDSSVIPTIKLDKVFRQSEKSLIKYNAHQINQGLMPTYNVKEGDFYFVKCEEGEIVETIVSLCTTRLTQYYGFSKREDIQVLSPMKKGVAGTIELNKKLQAALNPEDDRKIEKKYGEFLFRTGDRVMQVKNNYQIKWEIPSVEGESEKGEGVFNGDIGQISYIDLKNEHLWITFDDHRECQYDFSQLDELIPAYAITVHKSQGSEFPVVIMPMTWAPPMLLNRNLIYTAITRSQKLLVLVGNEKYLRWMIKNNKTAQRFSSLDYRLKQMEAYFGESL